MLPGGVSPIIWPLLAKLRHPIALQQCPRVTAGLGIGRLPVLPWDVATRPAFGMVDLQPLLGDTVPVNFGLCAIGAATAPLTNFLQASRPKTYEEQSRVPAIVHALPIPAKQFQISGQTKNNSGAALGGCVVTLYETATDIAIEKVTSNADGYFYFKQGRQGVAYYLVAYKAGSPDVASTTVNTLAAT